ncbi:DNA-directed DNA polymerase [Saccharomycopsis crataegensis]|uniref:DNA-directed DNA polymerase n=1 Tax=Saccharomycopsis crataegensis TaxID=43959 RepID=A0AAV5QIV3_9ASCO|nr:DNA-directed DNA polymerase [Saccharomycopsis crataegensis]
MVSTVSRDHYFSLASEIESERISGAISLIKELQAANEPKEWDYALSRLIKGLASPRAAARIGFSTALSEILNILQSEDKITVESYLQILNTQLNVIKSSKKGKDERANLFGHLFGLKSLVNSNLFFKAKNFDEVFHKFINEIIELSLSKSWIRESCFHTLFEFLGKLMPKLKDEQFIDVFKIISAKKLSLSTEGLSIYLLLHLHNKAHIFSKLNSINDWKSNNPMVKSNLHILAKTLKDIDASAGNDPEQQRDNKSKKDSTQKGAWSPNLHFVWPLIIRSVIHNDLQATESSNETIITKDSSNSKRRKTSDSKSSKKQKLASGAANNSEELIKIKEFWKIIINDSLFSLKASPERKYWGFKVFELFVNEISVSQKTATSDIDIIDKIDYLFTENFVRTLINQSGNSSRLLNGLVKKTLLNQFIIKKLSSKAENVPLCLALLRNFWFCPYSNMNFDTITGTKTTESLLNTIATFGSFDELVVISNTLLKVLEDPLSHLNNIEIQQIEKKSESSDAQKLIFIEKKQKWCVSQVSLLLKFYRVRWNANTNPHENVTVGEEIRNEWLDDIIKKLVLYGYFKPANEEEEQNEATYVVEVSNMISRKLGPLLLDLLPLKRVDNSSWLYTALKEARGIESRKSSKSKTSNIKYIPKIDIDQELQRVRSKNFKLLTKISQRKQQIIETDNKSASYNSTSKRATVVKKLSSFELIFSIVLLHFYSDIDAVADSVAILDEVSAAYKKFHLAEELSNDASDANDNYSNDSNNDEDDEDEDDDDDNEDDESNDEDESDRNTNGSDSIATGQTNESEEEFGSIDILLEIILGFVHQKSSLSKKLSLIVWETFVGDLRYRNFKSLYEILAVKENVEGQKKLFNTGDGDDNEEEDDDNEEEEEEDGEEEDSEEEDVDSESKDFLDVIDKKTTDELAKALKIPTKDGKIVENSDSESVSDDSSSFSSDDDDNDDDDDDDNDLDGDAGDNDDDDNSSDEESMDDEQMMAIDSQLSMIFKQRQSALNANHSKSGTKRHEAKIEAQENMVFFKNRILDLLDIYVEKLVKSSSTSGSMNDEWYVCLSMASPLLDLMGLTLNGDLRDKAHKLLKKLVKVKVVLSKDHLGEPTEEGEEWFVNVDSLFNMLGSIHEEIGDASTAALFAAYSQYSLYLSKILIGYDSNNVDKVVDVYTESMKQWIKSKNSKINGSMFFDLINYFSSFKQK